MKWITSGAVLQSRTVDIGFTNHTLVSGSWEYHFGRIAISVRLVYSCGVRFQFDKKKSEALRKNSKRGSGFEEAQEVFRHPYYLDQRLDRPEQYRAIGWVGGRLYALIFEFREDEQGEYYHLVTLWKATKEERKLYEENI